MGAIECGNWEDFESKIQKIAQDRFQLFEKTGLRSGELLYRGQSSHKWKLETTLERKSKAPVALYSYYLLINKVKDQIETFTQNDWVIPKPTEYEDWLSKQIHTVDGFLAYDYFTYLRHHGFPSPLLDWSKSPYVAAYFAFANARESDEKVSIYCYWESMAQKVTLQESRLSLF